MIKRITGLLAAAAVIGIIIWTALGRGGYTSALFSASTDTEGAPRQAVSVDTPPAADSLAAAAAGPAEDADSLAL
ncbi:MAG: hypothetical protein K2I43_01160 [Alistipes sp.]|nr:hypothetical protein [Alistipes sp.]MDE6857758.1 hypothetical protein [Alistipes sp.]